MGGLKIQLILMCGWIRKVSGMNNIQEQRGNYILKTQFINLYLLKL